MQGVSNNCSALEERCKKLKIGAHSSKPVLKASTNSNNSKRLEIGERSFK